MRPRSWLAFPLLIIAAAGCGTLESVAVGRPQPAKPPSCPIRFERLSLQEAMAKYQQVGVICSDISDDAVYDSNRDDADRRASIRSEACRLGGDVVTVVGLCSLATGLSDVSGTQIAVFRDPGKR